VYRCDICTRVTEEGQRLLRHPIKVPITGKATSVVLGTRIAQELKVCHTCDRELQAGQPLTVMMARYKGKRNVDRSAPPYKQGRARDKAGRLLTLVDNGQGKMVAVQNIDPLPAVEQPSDNSVKGKTKKQRKKIQQGAVNKPVVGGYEVPMLKREDQKAKQETSDGVSDSDNPPAVPNRQKRRTK
jgi:hypothetical protein